VAEPAVTPNTLPDASTVAIVELEDDHVPPEVVLARVDEVPGQVLKVPVSAPTAGAVFTVIA
jgi:hypothetical protein